MSRYRRCLTVAIVLLLGGASFAHAQGIASSFDQLRLLVRPGDTITVRDGAGTDTRGRIGSLSTETLVLNVGGRTRAYRQDDVTTIRTKRSDSLSNGALWGLGVGGGLAVLATAAACNGDDDCGGWAAALALVYGGIGAGIGVGVDALITRQHVIYERGVGSARLGIAPLVEARRRGAGAALSFRF